MKKFYNYLVWGSSTLLLALACVGCNIDDSYDLSDLDTDNMGIGTDESRFIMPLVEVELDLATIMGGGTQTPDLRSSLDSDKSGNSIEDIMSVIDDVSIFLPSYLSGDYEDGIDLTRLGDEEYTTGLVDVLFDELTTDTESLESFCEYILEQEGAEDYVKALDDILAEDISTYNAEQCAAELKTALLDEEFAAQVETLKSSIVDELVLNAADIETSFTLEEDLGNIGIDEDSLSILDQNLGGDNNNVRILAEVTTNLPLSVIVIPKLLYGDNQEFVVGKISDLDTDSREGMIDSVEQLNEILKWFVISASIDINNYNPAKGDLNIENKSLKIRLIAVKNGSLSLSFNN